jgi:hypothetical protein
MSLKETVQNELVFKIRISGLEDNTLFVTHGVLESDNKKYKLLITGVGKLKFCQ